MVASETSDLDTAGRLVGRYLLCGEFASGGMATVHVGRLIGPVDFSRTVALKRLLPQFAKDPIFVSMFMDEARLSASIRHPNVMPTLDIVAAGDELFVVMDYVPGESLSHLVAAVKEAGKSIPFPFAVSIVTQVLHGLHAAHEARDRRGHPLEIVHRDVSPQNVLVGVDGVARLLDFGIAKAASRGQNTADGQIKGKLAYMSREQIQQGRVDRRTDVFAASIVLWELLAGERLFATGEPGATIARILEGKIDPPSGKKNATGFPKEIDAIVLRGLAGEPKERFQTAQDMATALENVMSVPHARELGEWVAETAAKSLRERAEIVKGVERISTKMLAADSSRALTSLIESASSDLRRSEEPTDVSPAPVARPVADVPPPAGKPRTAIALGVLAALVVLGFVVLWPSTPSPAVAAAVSRAEPTSSAPPASSPVQPVAIDAEVMAPKSQASRPPRQGAPAPKKKVDCDPAYTVDEQGLKHFKPECL